MEAKLFLLIGQWAYRVEPIDKGWRLTKGDGTSYDVTGRTCQCANATMRGRTCKHQRALRELKMTRVE